MAKHQFNNKNLWLFAPIFGVVLFFVLYIIATLYYPGGSQIDKNSIGFSWVNNYWCNLLNETAINGESNSAKPIAIAGMLVICVTLSFFWFIFPIQIDAEKKLKKTIQFSGIFAMLFGFFLLSHIDHDLVIYTASLFGGIAIIGTLIGLYNKKWMALFVYGLLNGLLVGLNNIFYYNKELIVYLPIVQKISFASFLIWVCSINIKVNFSKE